MKRPDIEKFLGGVLRGRDKNPTSPLLRDFEEVLIYVKQLEAVEFERLHRDSTHVQTPCCSRDNDGDGNCDIHESPGILRKPQ